MTRKYRAAIIGCGGTSQFFIRGFGAAAERVEVVALCDIVAEQVTRRQADFPEVVGEAAAYEDYRAMLEGEQLDIVCLCAHGDTRLSMTEDCLAAGKHLFIEKPVGYTAEEARRFRYLADQHRDLKVAVAYSLRYQLDWMAVKRVIDSGALGEIVSGRMVYTHPRHEAHGDPTAPAPDKAERRYATDKMGNYIASSQLIHDTHPWDMARYLFGDVAHVQYVERLPVRMATMWTESGALVHVTGGTLPNAGEASATHEYVAAYGTKGAAWLVKDMEPPYAVRALYRTDGDTQPCPVPADLPDSSHGATLRTHNLLDAIEGKAELISSMLDGAATTDLLHAIWWSKRTGGRVPVFAEDKSG